MLVLSRPHGYACSTSQLAKRWGLLTGFFEITIALMKNHVKVRMCRTVHFWGLRATDLPWYLSTLLTTFGRNRHSFEFISLAPSYSPLAATLCPRGCPQHSSANAAAVKAKMVAVANAFNAHATEVCADLTLNSHLFGRFGVRFYGAE